MLDIRYVVENTESVKRPLPDATGNSPSTKR